MYIPKLMFVGALLGVQLFNNAQAAAPLVDLVRPTNGASFGTRSSILLRANASDSDGTLSSIDFFAGTNLLKRNWSTLTNGFFEFRWSNAPAGMHQLHAEAEDNVGDRGVSALVQITVTNSPPPNNLPVVSLIQPQNATTFPAGAPILLRANASDSDGTLTNIDFFANAALLGRIGGTLTNGVYSLMWSNPQPGMYSLRAEAVDDADGRGVSAPVQVSVSGAISNCQFSITVPPGFSMIANQCNNTNAGGNTLNNLYPGVPAGSKITKWNQAGQVFEPSAVFSGGVWSPNLTLNPGEGAFFENPTASPITLTSSGATPTPNLPLALPSPGCSIVSRQQPLVSGYNDIVGLAPQPGDVVFRFVSGNQSYRVWSFDEFDLVWINSQGLPEEPMANVGESIWVCRGGASPPPNLPTNDLPVVSLFQPTNGAVFSVGTSILLRANASDSDGTLTNIQFFAGTTLLRNISGTLTNGVYSFMWSNPPAGMYFLRAEAVDNVGGRGVSAPVQVSVSSVGNVRPVVTFIRPTDGAAFASGIPILMTADASVPVGSITNVEFRANATLLHRFSGQAGSSSSFSFNWTTAPVGTQVLRAIAWGNAGGVGTSAPVQITVTDTNAPPTNVVPVVNWIRPTNGASFPVSTIPLTVRATDADGSVIYVEFFATPTNQPSTTVNLGRTDPVVLPTNGLFTLFWSNAPAGSFHLQAVGVDNFGARGFSDLVEIMVNPAQCNYAITAPPGFSMIANQCNNTNAGGNTLNNLYPGVPAGSKITKWNQAGQVFEPSAVFSGGVWSPNLTLNPGEGAFFENPTASPITLTSSGATPTPNLPLALPSPGCSIVSRQQPLVGGYNDIVGLPPQPRDLVFRFVSGSQAYLVYVFDELDLTWTRDGVPVAPMANVGESIWVCRGVAPPSPPANTNPLDLGTVEVATIGHSMRSNVVVDFLIDQDQSSGGGGVLPNVSVNWDTNIQFKLTVAAPPDMRFLVTVPPGRLVRFGGFLWWESTRGGFSAPGEVSVSFTDLEGAAFDFSQSDSALSDSHGFFGFQDIDGAQASNSFSFTSITLTGTVAPQYTGNGTEDYLPHLDSFLCLAYSTITPNDPGSFVSIVPAGPLPMARMMGAPNELGVDILVYGRPGRTHIVECSTDIVTWIQISVRVMPPAGSMSVKDASATKEGNRFYRVVELP